MSTNPNRRPTETAYRPPPTQQPEIPERDRSPQTNATDSDSPSAPSVFAPIERSTIPDMFETEAEYEDR